MTKGELALWLEGIGFRAEVRGLVPGRRYRADWHHSSGVVVEWDGIMGRDPSHMSLSGVMRDQERANLMQLSGLIVIRVNAKTASDGRAQGWIEQALAVREATHE